VEKKEERNGHSELTTRKGNSYPAKLEASTKEIGKIRDTPSEKGIASSVLKGFGASREWSLTFWVGWHSSGTLSRSVKKLRSWEGEQTRS